MTSDTASAWPTEVRVNPSRERLSIGFDDGQSFSLDAEYLRVFSPSAEVQGHSPDQRVTVGGKKAVKIRQLETVGNYAVRIRFDDGHDTGLYTWSYLRELGEGRVKNWDDYVTELDAKGLTRDPAR